MGKIRVGIVGYGNLGKGVERAIDNTRDMEVKGVFTRRDPESLDTKLPSFSYDDILSHKDKLDLCILCGGSATDLIEQGPFLAKHFNTIDSYDNHSRVPEYFERIDEASKENKNLSLISAGWDPGLFSLNRMLGEAILPKGETYSFWGAGVSQGHSDAVRRIEGVRKATQFTIPNEEIIDRIKSGERLDLTMQETHCRECDVVLEAKADKSRIEEEIKTMPGYFDGYETTVNFMDEVSFDDKNPGMPHGGRVIRLGETSDENKSIYEFSLDLDSNPEFTAAVIVAYGRAVYKMRKAGFIGGISIYDVAPKYLSPCSNEELRERLL